MNTQMIQMIFMNDDTIADIISNKKLSPIAS